MMKIGDFSNRAGLHQPASFNADPQSVFKTKHPALAQIFRAVEQRTNPATRFLMNTKLAKMSIETRQKLKFHKKNVLFVRNSQ